MSAGNAVCFDLRVKAGRGLIQSWRLHWERQLTDWRVLILSQWGWQVKPIERLQCFRYDKV